MVGELVVSYVGRRVESRADAWEEEGSGGGKAGSKGAWRYEGKENKEGVGGEVSTRSWGFPGEPGLRGTRGANLP